MKKAAKKKSSAGKSKKDAKKKKPAKSAQQPQPASEDAKPGLPAVIPEIDLGGRPSLYREEYAEDAYKLCLLLNATDKDLADFFNVCEATINNWKIEFPKFLESIADGKTKADANVAAKLYARTQGAMWYDEVPTKVKREYWLNGKKHSEEEVVITKVLRQVPPDVKAQEVWLMNRVHLKWRNRMHHEMTGKDGKELPQPVVMINLNDKKACEDAAREILANL